MATKKISELPLVNRVSGSQVAGGSVLPIVIGGGIQGTTNQISVENFSIFVNAYNAHTGSSGNTFTGPQTINNNVTINGKLTVTELVATYETASIIYSEGGNIFGNELIDKQQFTGSSNFTGSVFINGQDYTIYSSSNSTVFTNFSSSNSTYNTTFSSSNAAYVTALSSSNSSYNTIFSSSNSSYNTIFSSSNSSYNTTFSSSNSTYVTALSSSNSSYNTIFSSSNSATITTFLNGTNSELARVYQTTQSLQVATASLNAFTASQDSRNFTISQFTSSTDAHIVGISAFTSSQLAVNLGNAIYTASVDSHIVGISTYTSSVRDTLARVHQTTQSLQVATASLNQFTASQDSRNLTLSTVTGSLIGITNGLMAYTASNTSLNTGLRGEVDGIEAYTASLKGQAIVSSSTQVQNYDVFALNSNLYTSTGSLIGITNGLMAFTAALDSTYATDAQLYQLYAETASIKAEIGGIELYTASLKAAAIVSSSTQIQNYNVFAQTASINTFYGNQFITGSITISDSINSNSDLPIIVSGSSTIGSLQFNGTNYLTFSPGIVVGSGAYTAETFVYITSYANVRYVLLSASTPGGAGFSFGILSTNQLFVDRDGVSSNTYDFASNFPTNQWFHIAVTKNSGGQETAFVNGVKSTSSYGTNVNYSGTTEAIGRFNASVWYLEGSISQTRLVVGSNVYDPTSSTITVPTSALTDITNTQILLNVETAGTYIDDTSGTQTLTNNNSVVFNSNGPVTTISNSEFTFGANGDLTILGNLISDDDFATTGSNTFVGDQIINGSINVNGGITGSLLATNGIVSSSQQIQNYNLFAQTASANTVFYGNVTASGNLHANQLYIGGATTASGLFGASEAVVQNELGIQFSDAAGTYMRLIANTANSNTAIVVGAFSGAQPPLDLIAGGVTGISVKNDGGVNFVGSPTASIFKIKTAGGGIDFSITSNGSGTTTSELLNDYEEGTFTPTFTGVNLTITNYGNRTGHYTKVGRLVTVTIHIMTEGVSATGSESVKIGGLPFTSANIADTSNSANIFNSARWNANPPICAEVALNSTEINLYSDRGATGAGTDPTTAKSGDMAIGTGNRNVVRLTATYFV